MVDGSIRHLPQDATLHPGATRGRPGRPRPSVSYGAPCIPLRRTYCSTDTRAAAQRRSSPCAPWRHGLGSSLPLLARGRRRPRPAHGERRSPPTSPPERHGITRDHLTERRALLPMRHRRRAWAWCTGPWCATGTRRLPTAYTRLFALGEQPCGTQAHDAWPTRRTHGRAPDGMPRESATGATVPGEDLPLLCLPPPRSGAEHCHHPPREKAIRVPSFEALDWCDLRKIEGPWTTPSMAVRRCTGRAKASRADTVSSRTYSTEAVLSPNKSYPIVRMHVVRIRDPCL
jgi:hypothetical protein